ncbi:prephenate dehydratase [Candidatus Woesearchaeota archaeon]|nr:prephenate dehydratase [Candidatus Woesearchaeota archaeon]
MRIAYQGIPGAHSEEAAKVFQKSLGIPAELVPKEDFHDLFAAVGTDADYAVVPIENSTAGSVVECYDLFQEFDVRICQEYLHKVEHCLLAKTDQMPKIIYSHPQALKQCKKFLQSHNMKGAEFIDTAAAAKMVSESSDPNVGAIASKVAAEHYNLHILKENIQDNSDNTTRFFLIGPQQDILPGKKTTLLFMTNDGPGALHKCLGVLANHNINLTKIESRPKRKSHFEYLFYVDLAADIETLRPALEELKQHTTEIRILGSYDDVHSAR